MAPTSIRVLIADDHPVVRVGLRNMLQSDPQVKVVAEARDGVEALHMVRTLRPDILLLDLAMPKMPGMEALRELTGENAGTRTIVLTAHVDKRQILEALQLGARGVVMKDAALAHLSACIRTVMQGQYWLEGRPVQNLVQVLRDLAAQTAPPPRKTFGLTARELEVVTLITEGSTNRHIAETFGISEETVKRHLTNIFNKIGVGTRLELALFALNHNLLPSEANQDAS
ncbi:MAG TPA: response regulator transcription factor [Candidatus Binatia bacterium]|nr:response regulator transcription factor [Candidatus Binatia bacterium]